MTDIRDVFAANVRKHRKAANLSQEKLAELSGLHRTYIGGIEQRRVNVSLKNIGKVADALGIAPAALFAEPDDGEGGMSRIPLTSPAELRPGTLRNAGGAGSAGSVGSVGGPSGGRGAGSANGVGGPSGASRSDDAGCAGGEADYALVTWHDGRAVMRPIEVAYEDLTVQVLCDLILNGYRGSDLSAHYSEVHAEIVAFLKRR